jgi:hypothetical protein
MYASNKSRPRRGFFVGMAIAVSQIWLDDLRQALALARLTTPSADLAFRQIIFSTRF